MSYRVGIIVYSLSGGGIPRSMINLAIGCLRRGYEVDLLVPHLSGRYSSYIPDDCNVIELGSMNLYSGLKSMIRYLNQRKPDLVISAIPMLNIRIISNRALSFSHCKIIVTERTTLSDDRFERTLKNKLLPTLQRFWYPKADAIVAVSKGVADDLSAYAKIERRTITTIHNPVVTDELVDLAERSDDADWSRHADVPVVLAAGRMNIAKGYK